jgi:hypothetical protein
MERTFINLKLEKPQKVLFLQSHTTLKIEKKRIDFDWSMRFFHFTDAVEINNKHDPD